MRSFVPSSACVGARSCGRVVCLLVLATVGSLLSAGLVASAPAAVLPLVWSQPQLVAPSFVANSVSCAPATSFCVAVSADGRAVSLYDGSWGSPASVDASHAITSVSCPTAAFCMAVDNHGYALRYAAGTWSAPQSVDGPASLASVSCVSASFCEAVDSAGYPLSFDGVTWSKGNLLQFGTALASVSCSSMTFCAAAAENGPSVFLFDGSFWSRPISVAPMVGGGEISCASASFCVYVGPPGYYTRYDGMSWSTPAPLADSQPFSAISCPSSSFCVAANSDHFVVVGDGSRWANTYLDGGVRYLQAVSCASTTFCVLLDDGGDAMRRTCPTPVRLSGVGSLHRHGTAPDDRAQPRFTRMSGASRQADAGMLDRLDALQAPRRNIADRRDRPRQRRSAHAAVGASRTGRRVDGRGNARRRSGHGEQADSTRAYKHLLTPASAPTTTRVRCPPVRASTR
jgi:hypothetical protein